MSEAYGGVTEGSRQGWRENYIMNKNVKTVKKINK